MNGRGREQRRLSKAGAYAFATCGDCGKHGYVSKQQAKQAARSLYPGTRMRVYRCGTLWHMTSHDAAAAARYRESKGPASDPA